MKLRMIVWGVVLVTLAGVAIEPVLELFPDKYWNELAAAIGTGLFAFVLTVVVAPLLEEGFFRGLGTRLLARWWRSDVWAIAVSAVLFAFAHYPIWPQVPNAFVGGLILGAAYRIARTLWVPIVIHALNNLLAWGMTEIFGDEYVSFRELIACEPAYWALWMVCTALFAFGMMRLYNKLSQRPLDGK